MELTKKARRCPICGGKPRFVHYAAPRQQFPDAWEETETGLEPVLTYKRIECEDCMATTMWWMKCDELIDLWNREQILEFVFREAIQEVEDAPD